MILLLHWPRYISYGYILYTTKLHVFINFIKVDCTEAGKETCNKFSVSGYPTLKIFKGEEVSQDYNGPREAAGIAKYMRAQVGPASKEIKSVEELDKFFTAKETTIFGYFKDVNSKLAKTFLKFADKNREKYRFGHSSNEEVLEKATERLEQKSTRFLKN